MAVYYFAQVERSFEDAEAVLLGPADGWADAAGIAYRHGEDLLARVGPGKLPIAKRVRLTVGEPTRLPGRTTIPLSWEATGASGMFPRMEADIILEPLGIEFSHVSFRGSYDPPLGVVGAAADRLVMHHLAEATVKRFVDDLVAAITGPGSPGATAPSAAAFE